MESTPPITVPVALTKAREPSLAAWRRIVAALDAQRDPRGLEADLAAVEAACAGWPDRQRLAPGRWLHDLFEGNSEPRLGVARAVDITLHGAHLRFELLPLSLGQIRGISLRFHLYTVPGPVFYDKSRELVLKGR